MATNIVTKAVVNNPDGSLLYRQEQEWAKCTPEMEQAIKDAVERQDKYLDDVLKNQKKTPDAIFSAVCSCTGQPDRPYDAFTFDSFQKARQNWNKLGDELDRMVEKQMRKG